MKRRRPSTWNTALIVGLVALIGGPVPARSANTPRPAWVPSAAERGVLLRYARDSWRSFEVMELPSGLPADALRLGRAGSPDLALRTTPTNIAAYLWSTLAADRLRLIEPVEADRRVDRTLATLARMGRVHGFFPNHLDPRSGEPLVTWPDDGRPVRPFLSAVDNGWLAAALIMVGNARPGLRDRAVALLGPMDFGYFYDAYDAADPLGRPGQLRGGDYLDDHTSAPRYRMVNTEPRIASYIGIARGQLPAEHYFRLFRGRPTALGPQKQIPRGETRTYQGVAVFEGHYTCRGLRIVPSWGGSMFEALMVPLFVPEDRWAPRSWGVNHRLYVRAQIEHGLVERRYGFWGFSPACDPDGGYEAYGVEALGAAPKGYHAYDEHSKLSADSTRVAAVRHGVVTPHASFLALPFAPREALANLRALEAKFPIYGPFGFRDSVDVATGVVSDTVLALDQGMILAAIANALADNAMQHAFSDGPVEAAIRPLIAPEEFTAGPPDEPRSSAP